MRLDDRDALFADETGEAATASCCSAIARDNAMLAIMPSEEGPWGTARFQYTALKIRH